ncbi:VWA domain-containing protein [Saccharopolyspora cebuensis]|uniref:VWA domain-containing protein n=1 Tax=Saccharopolyspora cebuensis TaxID=418759 RepID=A0ABV4CQQ6_9PSEU
MPSSSGLRALVAGALAVVLVAGCTGGEPGEPDLRGAPHTLRVLGSSELADMRPILDEARQATGVSVELTGIGSVEGTELLRSGHADGRYDATWFASDRYVSLYPEAQDRRGDSTKIMSSPVLLGLRASTAAELGWDRAAPSWLDIAEAAEQRRFSFGMTNPAKSNSGMSALVGIATALADTGSALDVDQARRALPELRGFFAGQTLTSGSSGWLSQSYQRRGSAAGEPVDGLVNYESVLLSMNASGDLDEPLVPIHPRDGVATADYPLTLLRSASDEARSAYQRLTDYLRLPRVQQRIMELTHRRPITAQVELTPELRDHPMFELPFPARPAVVDELLLAYFDQLRRPTRTLYVLDTSGSMRGDRLTALKDALGSLTGAGETSRFDRFHNREQVTLLPFNSTAGPAATFDIPERDPGPVLADIRAHGERLGAAGETALYDALLAAFALAAEQGAADPDRFTSIVLMTDGENNRGRTLAEFTAAPRPPVPVFPILFGEGAVEEMRAVADATGGKVFDARTQSLTRVFAEVRGYQ